MDRSIIVVWDDNCSFCARSIRLIRRLDWRRRISYVGSSDNQALARLNITPEAADREIQVVTDGSIAGGYDGIIEIARRLPLTWPLAPLLATSPMRRLGTLIYRRIAANRHCKL